MDISQDSGFFVTPQGSLTDQFSDFEEISSSKYTVVVKARKYGQWFILKALAKEFRGRGQYEALLRKEYAIGFRFNHPSIVRYIDFVSVEGLGNCIQMEYIVGQRLDQYLHEGPSLKDKKRIILQIADGLRAIHSEQIVHRDLKPENILITANEHNVKIIDFGLSDADNYAILKEPAGTTGYSSPEQIAGAEALDNRSDIFSFGKIIEGMDLPFYYKRVVSKCCANKRGARYATVEDVVNDFKHAHRKFVGKVLGFAIVLIVLIFAITFARFMFNQEENEKLSQKDSKDRVVTVSHKQQVRSASQRNSSIDGNKAGNNNVHKQTTAPFSSVPSTISTVTTVTPPTESNASTAKTTSVDELANQLHGEIDKIIDPYIAKRKAGINIAEHQTFMHIMERKTDKLYDSFFARNDLEGNVTILKQEFDRYCREKMNEYYSAGKVRDLTSKERAEIIRRQMPQLRKFYESRKAHRDTTVARP